jgi:PII-like signaling protein
MTTEKISEVIKKIEKLPIEQKIIDEGRRIYQELKKIDEEDLRKIITSARARAISSGSRALSGSLDG